MQTIAQQWLVYRLTGSMVMLGVVSLVGVLPLLPLSLWGGSLADRFPKRSIIVATQTAMMVQAFILTALTWSGAVQVWHVMVLAVVLGAANAVDVPARQSFVVEMVNGKEDLMNAIGLNSTIFNGARAIGPRWWALDGSPPGPLATALPTLRAAADVPCAARCRARDRPRTPSPWRWG